MRVAVELSAAEAAVVVTDDGPGIAAAEQDRVFQRFWRGRTEFAGTGSGSPIANQVAVAHGGSAHTDVIRSRPAQAASSGSRCVADSAARRLLAARCTASAAIDVSP